MSVTADQEAVEAVSEILSRACGGGVAVEAPFELVEEGLGAHIASGRPAIVRGYVAAFDQAAARRAVAQAERDLGHLQAFGLRTIGEIETRVVHEEEWAEAWKEHFPVQRVGRRIVIRPTWREHVPQPDDVIIALDPGMAFGTGLHPTTRLCLAGLEEWADEGLLAGARLLDLGCGSGILGIAAGLLGADQVLGLDTDSLAVEVTTANARRNDVAGVVTARTGSLPLTVDEPFDLVAANLVASLLVDLAPELADALRPEGRLLAGGIFADREAEVGRAFESVGLVVVSRRADTDWLALEAVRRSAA